MYNALIHTIEPKAQLVKSSKFTPFHYSDSDHLFHDSRLKLDINFITSPYVDPMVKYFKKLKASKLNNLNLIKYFHFKIDLYKNKIYSDI